jgi:hypothetical protein
VTLSIPFINNGSYNNYKIIDILTNIKEKKERAGNFECIRRSFILNSFIYFCCAIIDIAYAIHSDINIPIITIIMYFIIIAIIYYL